MVNNMVTKKATLVLTTLLIANTTWADTYSKEEKTTNFVITPSIAYRYDVFKWSIPHHQFNKKVSELIWKNYIIQPGIKIETEPEPKQFTFLGQVKCGYILKKPSKSWDYDWDIYQDKTGNIISDPDSKTKSSVKGNIIDLSGAVGYSVNLFNNNLLTFYIGYDYTDYRNKNYGIHQQVNNSNDLLYSPDQLVSKYYFKTYSPWVGVSVNTHLSDKFSIIPTIKFYSFKYIGKGYWIHRGDLKQNPSFKHNSKGKSLSFDLDFLYKYSDSLDFKINLETKRFKMRSGQDKAYLAKDKRIQTRKLYDLSLISSSISAGFSYKL